MKVKRIKIFSGFAEISPLAGSSYINAQVGVGGKKRRIIRRNLKSRV